MTTIQNDDTLTPGMIRHIESHLGGIMSEYITGTRKSKFYNEKKKLESNLNDDETFKTFYEGLKSDITAYRNKQIVSECAFFAPRKGQTSNQAKKDFVNKLTNALYPSKSDTREDKIKSYVSYQKCLSTLTKKFKEQEFAKVVEKEKFRVSRLAEHKGLWCSLKSRPLSIAVTEPLAMPVDISREEELDSFFDFLEKNLPVDSTSIEYNTKWIPDEECFKFNKGAVYTDGRMDLCKQVVGPLWINRLMKSLKDNDQIKHFLLGNNIIGTVGALAIKNFLLDKHKPKIQTWYLAGNDINSEGIEYLVDGLQYDRDVKELWLKRNPIKITGMIHIKRLLENNQNIITLDLHNVATLDDGLVHLAEGLKNNKSLRNLYLEANGTTEKGVTYLIEYFDYLVSNGKKGITSLWIGMNRIGDDGISKLVKSIGNYPHMERLCIGSNMITSVSCPVIYEAFKSHPSLKVLDLGMYKSTADMGEITNRISNEGVPFIVKLIKENKTIEYLSILHNDISNEAMKHIESALRENDTLLYLDFKQYFVGIEQDVYVNIREKLKKNRYMKGIADEKEYFRTLKHTKEIINIDSIYRNNSKEGKTCVLKKGH